MPKYLPLGANDFADARTTPGATVVDKTAFIGRVLRSPARALVICRPRRFGKTMNITMLRDFLRTAMPGRPAAPDALFAGMAAHADPLAMAERAQHPVVYLSLKGVKSMTWPDALETIGQLMAATLRECGIDRSRAEDAEALLLEAVAKAQASPAVLALSLKALTSALQAQTGRQVWLLIDEYDAPIQTAWQYGYYPEAVAFFRTFFGEAAKDNPSVARTVMTGVMRVAKEGILSDLNNLQVDTVLEDEFATDFGFTEAEVDKLANDDPALRDGMRQWYNGYTIGGHAIYNPWSVAETLTKPRSPLQARWIATGGTDLLERLASQSPPSFHADLERWLMGEVVDHRVVQGVALADVERHGHLLPTMLLHAGYLTAQAVRFERGHAIAALRTPNEEVRTALEGLYQGWLADFGRGGFDPRRLCAALLSGDEETVQRMLGGVVRGLLSYHDLADKTPERIYHVFVLGVLSQVPPGYRIESNREYGSGRPDVVLIPGSADQPGAVIEFKAAKRGTDEADAELACDAAEAQIRVKRYREAGVGSPVLGWAVGFAGKEVVVRLLAAVG
ncbi:MAG: AAA family ATPase [Deltaproteobacteria bacterium]|nr:AAA family ATPase [Deltaproteobacteria bacterium]